MKFILEDLPDDVGIAIEFNIPLTSKRIDFVVTGFDQNHEPVIFLFELKQWESVIDVKSEDAIIKTVIENKEKKSLHPSYQAFCYAELLLNYNRFIEKNRIQVFPVVYLHNYSFQENDPMFLNKFKQYYRQAPIYGKEDKFRLKEFVSQTIFYGDQREIIKQIDQSEVKPNKKLLDALDKMIQS